MTSHVMNAGSKYEHTDKRTNPHTQTHTHTHGESTARISMASRIMNAGLLAQKKFLNTSNFQPNILDAIRVYSAAGRKAHFFWKAG